MTTTSYDMNKPVKSNIKDKKDDIIQKLEKLLATEIQRAADFLKENEVLEEKFKRVKTQRDSLHRYWKRSQKENKTRCDRDKAMIEYADVDMSEVIGSK